jgi:hypothetical protein
MTQIQSNPFSEFDDDLNQNDRPTWPPPGSADLVIVDQYEALFYSATWTIVASVNGEIIHTSREAHQPHDQLFIKRWSKQFVRIHYSQLRELGVDADAEYVKFGGNLDDLG